MLRDYRLDDIRSRLGRIGLNILDVMLIGGTGTGKSTTLNVIFQTETAKVGHSFAPETMNVSGHMLNDNFRLWDTPGLVDGFKAGGTGIFTATPRTSRLKHSLTSRQHQSSAGYARLQAQA